MQSGPGCEGVEGCFRGVFACRAGAEIPGGGTGAHRPAAIRLL